MRKKVVVNFAGGGGSCRGLERAFGYSPHEAINHDLYALGMHRINHPWTRHWCENVFDVDPAELEDGCPLGFGWFSPDCKHHSKAKGGKPVDKRIRGLVIVMLKYAKRRCEVMMMENVEEIAKWGPLVRMVKKSGKSGVAKAGWYPDPQNIGRCWNAFLACLGGGIDPDHPDLPEFLEVLDGYVTKEECIRGFGYKFDAREIRAYTKGTPTTRKRLYMIARCDGKPIVWPEATHAKPSELKPGQKVWRTVAECLDLNLPCPSIFLNKQQAKAAKCKRPLAHNTLKRVATGIGRFVIHSPKPFIVNLTHAGAERVEATDEPFRTITGAHRGEKALCVPLAVNLANGENDTAPSRNIPIDSPLPTQTTSEKFGAAAVMLTECSNASKQRNFRADEPLRTVCAETKGGHFATVAASLVPTGYGEREGQQPRGQSLDEPAPAVVACGAKQAVVAASMVKMRGDNVGDVADAPLHTVSAGGTHHGLVVAELARSDVMPSNLVRSFGQSIGAPLDEPCPTVMPGGQGKTSLVALHVAQQNGGFNTVPGHSLDEPISAVTATGSQQNVIATSMALFFGTEKDGQATDEALRTVTTKPRAVHVESSLAAPPLTEVQIAGARRVAKFLRRFGVEFEGEFATVGDYVIIDIGLRMLTPRELFRAQGFDDERVSCYGTGWRTSPRTGLAAFAPQSSPPTKTNELERLDEPAAVSVRTKSGSKGKAGKLGSARMNPELVKSVPSASSQESTANQGAYSAHVGVHVQIDYEHRTLVLRSAARLHESASTVEQSEKFRLPTEIAASAQQLAHTLRCEDRRAPVGKAGTSQRVSSSTPPKSGQPSESLFGDETRKPANSAAKSTTTCRTDEHGLSITLEAWPNSSSCGSTLETLSSFVARVIASSTQEQIRNASSFDLEVELVCEYVIDRAWIQKKVGDPVKEVKLTKEQQIRMCGNAVCPDVAEALARANCPDLIEHNPQSSWRPQTLKEYYQGWAA